MLSILLYSIDLENTIIKNIYTYIGQVNTHSVTPYSNISVSCNSKKDIGHG